MTKGNNGSAGPSIGQERRVKGSEVFVGGLVRTATESEIREVFSTYGEIVELRMMKDENGTSKGFCFVRFATKEAALRASKEKNGIMVQGKKVGVSLSSDKDQLFFGNLRKEWSCEEFDKLVRQAFKDVVSVNLAMPPCPEAPPLGKKRVNRGFAFVLFSSHAAAARAYRVGSRKDFKLTDGWHPSIDWAQKPEVDSEEMTKVTVAFIGNLPANADEGFLMTLFEPYGKIERVAISRKSDIPVGFIYFANRSEVENAIREMNGKTVQGPHNGPTSKIQVAVAKSLEKNKKRIRDETSNPQSRSDSLNSGLILHSLSPESKAPRFANLVVDPVDPYEEAVISLPSIIKERLLRVFRLKIASRYDVNIRCIASLKELPESAAISVLDQFMLSGAEKSDKGAYLTSLISKHQFAKLASRGISTFPRSESDFVTKESKLICLQDPHDMPSVEQSAIGCSSHRDSTHFHSNSSSFLEDPLRTRSSFGWMADPVSFYTDPNSRSSLARLGDAVSSYQDLVSQSSLGRLGNPVSRSSVMGLEPVPQSSLERLAEPLSLYRESVSEAHPGRLEDTMYSFRDPISRSTVGRLESVCRSGLGKLEDPVSSYMDTASRSSLGRSEDLFSRPTLGRLDGRDSTSQVPVPPSGVGRVGDILSSCRDLHSSSLGHASGSRSVYQFIASEQPSLRRPQIKFDPFTGQPYKFDPFTGEPIHP